MLISTPTPPATTPLGTTAATTASSLALAEDTAPSPPPSILHDTSILFKCLVEGDASYAEQYNAQRDYPTAYSAMLKASCERGLGLPRRARPRILAAFWVHKNWQMSEYLLTMPGKAMLGKTTGSDLINFVDFCSAVKLLDSGRVLRAKRKKLATLEAKQARRAAAAEAEADVTAEAEATAAATTAEVAKAEDTANTAAVAGWGSGSDDVLSPEQAVLLLPPTAVRMPFKPKKATIFSTDAKLRRRVGELRSEINALEIEQVDLVGTGSMSGALSTGLRRVVGRIPATKLEFFALQLGLQGWRELADVLHISPDKVTMPGFMARVFGGDSASQDERLHLLNTITRDTAAERVLKLAPSYEFLRTKIPDMDDATKLAVAKTAPIDTCLWWLDELATEEVCDVVAERLDGGEQPTLSLGSIMQLLLSMYQSTIPLPVQSLLQMGFGRSASNTAAARYGNLDHAVEWLLSGAAARYHDEDTAAAAAAAANTNTATAGAGMAIDAVVNPVCAALFERLLPLADAELAKVSLPLASPTVVVGDSSASMDVAIRTSVIIAALLSHLCEADLWFFSETARRAPLQPKNVADALDVAMSTKASGCTSPAAALWQFYKEKRSIAVLVVVTDEEENQDFNGFSFAALFQKYRQDVNPLTKVVFVSFIASGDGDGPMVASLKATGVNPLVFTFDPVRPDLTKLDNLFAILSIHTDAFNAEIQAALQHDLDTPAGTARPPPPAAASAPSFAPAEPTSLMVCPSTSSTHSSLQTTSSAGAAASEPEPAPARMQLTPLSPIFEDVDGGDEVLTADALEEAATALKKEMLGNRLLPKVEALIDDKTRAGKITGMLLELDNETLLQLLVGNGEALTIRIKEAGKVFDDYLQMFAT